MRCLIVGASGQVGGLLLARSRQLGHVALGTAFRHPQPGHVLLDIRDEAAVSHVVRSFRPEAVFLPAALVNMELAEARPEECSAVNVQGVVHVAMSARTLSCPLVYFSTDHVFSERDQAHREEEGVAPQSAYAKSKVAGERVLRDLLPRHHLILRTSWVFGPEVQRKNFVYRTVDMLSQRGPLLVPEDQYGQPTYAPDLVDTAFRLLANGARGTFHAVGPEALSRLEFAHLIARAFDLNAGLIRGTASAHMRQAAPRPLKPLLARDKLLAVLGSDTLRPPRPALQEMTEVLSRRSKRDL